MDDFTNFDIDIDNLIQQDVEEYLEENSFKFQRCIHFDKRLKEWISTPVLCWETRDKKLIPITKMSDEHLKRCIILIKKKIWRTMYLPVLESELKRRSK